MVNVGDFSMKSIDTLAKYENETRIATNAKSQVDEMEVLAKELLKDFNIFQVKKSIQKHIQSDKTQNQHTNYYLYYYLFKYCSKEQISKLSELFETVPPACEKILIGYLKGQRDEV